MTAEIALKEYIEMSKKSFSPVTTSEADGFIAGYRAAEDQIVLMQAQIAECVSLLYRACTELTTENNQTSQLTMSDIWHYLHNEHSDFMNQYENSDFIPMDNKSDESSKLKLKP